MLPGIFPAPQTSRNFDIYATMQPAREGGETFTISFWVDQGHLGSKWLIADVSGKGVHATVLWSSAKTL